MCPFLNGLIYPIGKSGSNAIRNAVPNKQYETPVCIVFPVHTGKKIIGMPKPCYRQNSNRILSESKISYLPIRTAVYDSKNAPPMTIVFTGAIGGAFLIIVARFCAFGCGTGVRTHPFSAAVDFEFFGGRGPFRKLAEAITLYFPTKSANPWPSLLQKARNY